MIKKGAKGARNEARCKKELIEDGYQVESVKRLRYGPTDFWGIFDVIAVSSEQIRFIQVKSNRREERWLRERIRAFRCPDSCSKEVCVNYDYKGWKKWRITDDGEEKIV